jgi:hypothetical protein
LLMTHASKESSSTFLWRVVGFVDSWILKGEGKKRMDFPLI